ncbi:hypothetical protein [Haloprofundus halobius]|uniref:hypothetical protein n=1 Tax=Haloprofundus halobius TaxID=2876194 RepID=UPI001CCD7B83|nr:hypothetical protein [Haloprofundus halobius]
MPGLVAERVVDAVRTHAETVLEYGRDRYGSERTPLLADAIHPSEKTALAYDARDVGDGRRLSNFAVQQEFLRTLVALTALTGEAEFRDEAERIASWVTTNLIDSAGLFYWGGHTAYDLDADELVFHKGKHELKFEYPFYELLFDVDAERTRCFVKAFWDAHVCDWSTLDFNRHGAWGNRGNSNDPLGDSNDSHDSDDPVGDVWNRDYEGGEVFFWGDGLTFVNTGSDLYYAAAQLAAYTGDDAPLRWSKRLAKRYVETRQEPGISGYQFSQHPSYCNGPAIRGDRAQYQFAPYVHGDHLVYEGTLFRPRPLVQRQQLALGERFGDRGGEFTRWAVEELRAWYTAAYRPESNDFEPMLTDGLSLEGFVCRREGYFGPKGRVVGPIEAGPEFFWAYARAVRLTDDPVCWRAVREIGAGIGVGAVGDAESVELKPRPTERAVESDYATLCGVLELYRATGDHAYLESAIAVGEKLRDERYRASDGGFVDCHGRIRLDDPVPLALLHLAAEMRGDGESLPSPVGEPRTPAGGI